MSVHDRGRQSAGRRYEVRWREGGMQRKRRFDAKAAAVAFDAEKRLDRGIRNAREGRRLTVAAMMDTWLATKRQLKPKSVEACELDAAEVKAAPFGERLAANVRNSEIRVWVARTRGASIRRRSLGALRQAYKLAIADELLSRDPTEGVPLPKSDETDKSGLTWAELEELASAAGVYRPMVMVLGTCGLRIGEACRLDVADVGETRLRVRKSKSGKPRDVPIMPEVRALLDLSEPGPLFRSPTGLRADAHNWRERVFDPAADAAGLGTLTIERAPTGRVIHRTYKGVTPHTLRHTAASLAVQSGADVSVVSRMLGHANPAITLRIYTHLFDSSLDSVVGRMSQAREGAKKAHDVPASVPKTPNRDGIDGAD